MKISIVTTLYNSAPYIQEFYRRISDNVRKITDDYNIIVVNDGSPDNSLDIALELKNNDEKITIIDLSKNFGHHKAIFTGLIHTDADFVFLIDADLEEEPELLSSFWNVISKNNSIDVVYGIQKNRKGGLFERISGNIFWKLFSKMSNIKNIKNVLTVRIMSKRYVETLKKYTEKELFLGGLFESIGFKQIPLIVDKKHKGQTTYTLSLKLKLFANAITSFSTIPLYFIFYIGTIIAVISLLLSIYLFVSKLIYGDIINAGWVSLMLSIWFLSGTIMIFIGIIGVYLSKIFNEVKNRPLTNIKKIY